ncbi:MAG: MBL fold metallo-hydrolase [Phycisphaerales bacterium]
MNRRTPSYLLGFAVAAALSSSVAAQGRFDDVQIKTVKVSENVYMLVGSGGNIGLSIGEDGAFMIDDQFAPLTDKILAAVRTLTDQPVRFLVNTHWHGDHVGGNENMGKAGAIIVAHENVRKSMSTEHFMEAFNRSLPASPEAALPVVTFTDAMNFHWNGDDVHVFHVEPAHTDGDSIIHFRHANVLHTGDTFFNGMYPYIDVSSGGSIDGVIAAADTALKLCNDKTKIIPGHGELADADDLRAYREVLQAVRDRVRSLVDAGKTREEVIAAKPSAEFDADWGAGFMRPDVWIGIVYDGMTKD